MGFFLAHSIHSLFGQNFLQIFFREATISLVHVVQESTYEMWPPGDGWSTMLVIQSRQNSHKHLVTFIQSHATTIKSMSREFILLNGTVRESIRIWKLRQTTNMVLYHRWLENIGLNSTDSTFNSRAGHVTRTWQPDHCILHPAIVTGLRMGT